jgi:hypothetical protein
LLRQIGADDGVIGIMKSMAVLELGQTGLIAIGTDTAPYIYVLTLPDFTLLPAITSPGSQINAMDFSADGTLLSAASQSSPYVHRYQVSDWSKLANPAVLPTGPATGIDFSRNGTWLAVAHTTTPYVTVYQVSDWSKLANPGTLPTGSAACCRFNPPSTQLAVGHLNSPFITTYNTTTWAKFPDPLNLPTAFVQAISWTVLGGGWVLLSTPGASFPARVAELYNGAGNPWVFATNPPANEDISGNNSVFSEIDALAFTTGASGTYTTVWETVSWSVVPGPTVGPSTGQGGFAEWLPF